MWTPGTFGSISAASIFNPTPLRPPIWFGFRRPPRSIRNAKLGRRSPELCPIVRWRQPMPVLEGRPSPISILFCAGQSITTSGASMRLRVGRATFISMKRRLCPTGNFVGPSARHSAVMRNVPRRCAVMMNWRAVQRHAYASPGARSMPTKNIAGKIGSW